MPPRQEKLAFQQQINENEWETRQSIFFHEEYTSWKNNDEQSLLWIYGEDGLGKTPLTISLMNDLKDRVERSSKRRALTYSFCQPSSGSAKDAPRIVRELLYQLIAVQPHDRVDIFEPLLSAYQRYKQGLLTSSRLNELWLVLIATLKAAEIENAYLLLYRPEHSGHSLLDSFPTMIDDSWRTPCYMKWIVISRFDPAKYAAIKVSHRIDLYALSISQPSSSEPHPLTSPSTDGEGRADQRVGEQLPEPALVPKAMVTL